MFPILTCPNAVFRMMLFPRIVAAVFLLASRGTAHWGTAILRIVFENLAG
jgi:hypothetical protein